jgi:transcriptional regulator with XRE-family HTH domain
MTFSENLNRICKEKGYTVSTLLKKMGVSTSKVTLWNNGSLPKQEMLLRLAKELECAVMDFFADDDAETPMASSVIIDEDEKEIIRLFRGLTNKERHKFMAQAYSYEETTLRKKE